MRNSIYAIILCSYIDGIPSRLNFQSPWYWSLGMPFFAIIRTIGTWHLDRTGGNNNTGLPCVKPTNMACGRWQLHAGVTRLGPKTRKHVGWRLIKVDGYLYCKAYSSAWIDWSRGGRRGWNGRWNGRLIGNGGFGSFDCRCFEAIYRDCLLASIEEDFESLVTSWKHLARTIARKLKWAAYPVASKENLRVRMGHWSGQLPFLTDWC